MYCTFIYLGLILSPYLKKKMFLDQKCAALTLESLFPFLPGRGSNTFLKRLQHGPAEVTRWRPGSVYFPPRSKHSIRQSFVSLDCNKARHYTTQRALSSPHRSNTYNAMTKGHQQSSFPVKSAKSEVTSESINIQMPVTKTTAKTSALTVSFGR